MPASIAIVCGDSFHEGRLPVVAEFERDEIAGHTGVDDWAERSTYRRGAELVGPARGAAARDLGSDDQPITSAEWVPDSGVAHDLNQWPNPRCRVRYELACGVCNAGPVRARHDKLRVILDRFKAARQDQISLTTLEAALALVPSD